MRSITIWKYSLSTEVERMLHTAHQIIVGFYKANNFIVLPQKTKSLNANLVIFPKLEYKKIPKFWQKASKIDIYPSPFVIDTKLRRDFYNLLLESTLDVPNYTKVKNLWTRSESEVINAIYDLLPKKKGLIKKVVIYPTRSGTSCSFSLNENGGEIIIYLREGQGIHTIAEAIVTSLTRNDIYQKLNGMWQESEIITDFLITQTKLATVLQKHEIENSFTPTIKGTRVKDIGNLSKLSDEYYKELNIPDFDRPFSLNGLTPEINKKPILNLTNNEKQIICLLIKNSNNVVSFDQISDIIFANEEKFSLFALAKFIQRLREKLEKNGISGSFIQTLRGKGYLLKN